MNKQIKKQIIKIANDKLRIPTLDDRGSDRLDFYDLSVSEIKEALEEAFFQGAKHGSQTPNRPLRDEFFAK